MSDSKMKKYGNDIYWCFLEDGWEASRPIEIWKDIGLGQSEVIAHASDKYNAMMIIDALLTHDNITDNKGEILSKKETIFLSFVESNCPEPYATMAANAILWNDKEAYKNLKSKFNEIY